MAALGNAQHPIATCPACGIEIVAILSLEAALGEVDAAAKTVAADVKITGLRVSHDCVPKVMR